MPTKKEKEDVVVEEVTANCEPEYVYDEIINGQKVQVKRYPPQRRPDIFEAVPKASKPGKK